MSDDNDDVHEEPEITFEEGAECGKFTDCISIGFTGEAVLMNIMQMIPEGGMHVHGRFILTPAHLSRLARCLVEKIAEYEQVFGPIHQPEPNKCSTSGSTKSN